MPTLADLLDQVPDARLLVGRSSVEVTSVAYHSGRVAPGAVFVAVPGLREDGLRYAADAVARGAVAVVGRLPHPLDLPVAQVDVPSPRAALAALAAAFYGHPSRRLGLVGVTGTDGKTTTTHLIAALLERAGLRVGWLSTVDVRLGTTATPSPFGHTTPEAVEVQASLATMADQGLEWAVLEVSSHALALDRVGGCAFDVAVFTNLSPEHLNFHGTLERYCEAKGALFAMLDASPPKGRPRFGVVNADDEHAEHMRSRCRAPVLGFGFSETADVRATVLEAGPRGTRFGVRTPRGAMELTTPLVGRFNVANWLAAIAVGVGLDLSLDAIAEAVATTAPIEGRLQWIDEGQPFDVVVDFAHTPQALRHVLTTLRQLARGRLLLVFGMAGGRDAGNRPVAGRIAAELADFSVITMDDPGDEDPEEIARQIAAGLRSEGRQAGEDFCIEIDRRRAIALAFERARPGDVVLLAGKGHERRMVVGSRALPWSDAHVARELLAALGFPATPRARPDR